MFCDNSKIQVSKPFCELSSMGLSHSCPWVRHIFFMTNLPLTETGNIKPNRSNRFGTFDNTSLCVHCDSLSEQTLRQAFDSSLSNSLSSLRTVGFSRLVFDLWILRRLKPFSQVETPFNKQCLQFTPQSLGSFNTFDWNHQVIHIKASENHSAGLRKVVSEVFCALLKRIISRRWLRLCSKNVSVIPQYLYLCIILSPWKSKIVPVVYFHLKEHFFNVCRQGYRLLSESENDTPQTPQVWSNQQNVNKRSCTEFACGIANSSHLFRCVPFENRTMRKIPIEFYCSYLMSPTLRHTLSSGHFQQSQNNALSFLLPNLVSGDFNWRRAAE